MEIEEWKQRIMSAKPSICCYEREEHKVLKAQDGLRWFIYDSSTMGKCKTCGHCTTKPRTLSITFYKPIESLTIFEVEMISQLYFHNKRVGDYAQWHKCIAGKEFIKNIDTIIEL